MMVRKETREMPGKLVVKATRGIKVRLDRKDHRETKVIRAILEALEFKAIRAIRVK
jgi:hypothetical protein